METKVIGSKIAEARKKLNMSQAKLSTNLFISPQAVGKWERGESMPDILTLTRLAEILGVDLNYFSSGFESNKIADPVGSDVSKLTWDMSNGNWVGADFSGLKNLKEKFNSSNLQSCLFVGSDLSSLLLKNNHVDGCDFSDSNFKNSHIGNSHIVHNLFTNCALSNAEFSGSHIKTCDFSGADFTGSKFKSCSFHKNLIAGAIFKLTTFNGTYISDVIFSGIIEDCYFENAEFARVTFQGAKLVNTFFKNQNLKNVKFINCQADRITYEFLRIGKADLSGVNLF